MEHHLPEEIEHKPKISSWHIRTFVITVVAAIVGYFIFILWGGWHQVIEAFSSVGFKGIFAALGLSLLSLGIRFVRWQSYLIALDSHIPVWESLRIYISGFALTTTPGKSGETLRCVFLKEHGVTYRKSLGAFFSERTSDLISVVILSTFSLWHYPKALPLLIGLAVFLVVFLLTLQRKSWLEAIEKFAKRKLPDRFAHVVEFCVEMVLALNQCFKIRMFLWGTFLGVLAWLAIGVAFYYILLLLGQEISLSVAVFINSFGLLVGGITFLPGGLGTAEGTMIQLLVLYHVPFSLAIAATLVIRLTSLWFSVVLGLLLLPSRLSKLKSKEKKQDKQDRNRIS